MANLHFASTYPTFGTAKRPKADYAWKCSVYYWWWEYLRRNAAYKRCCEQNGKGRLAGLYKNFGDVHAGDFKTWWNGENNRGGRLFAEQAANLVLSELTYEQAMRLEKWDADDVMVVIVPLTQSKRHLAKRFNTLLKNRHSGERGKRLLEKSTAKYKVTGQFKIDSLKTTLAAYDLRIAEPKKTLWSIALEAGLAETVQKELKEQKEMDTQQRTALAIAAHRAIKRAKEMIDAAAKGGFPKPPKT
jgi:hypothetical protein